MACQGIGLHYLHSFPTLIESNTPCYDHLGHDVFYCPCCNEVFAPMGKQLARGFSMIMALPCCIIYNRSQLQDFRIGDWSRVAQGASAVTNKHARVFCFTMFWAIPQTWQILVVFCRLVLHQNFSFNVILIIQLGIILEFGDVSCCPLWHWHSLFFILLKIYKNIWPLYYETVLQLWPIVK